MTLNYNSMFKWYEDEHWTVEEHTTRTYFIDHLIENSYAINILNVYVLQFFNYYFMTMTSSGLWQSIKLKQVFSYGKGVFRKFIYYSEAQKFDAMNFSRERSTKSKSIQNPKSLRKTLNIMLTMALLLLVLLVLKHTVIW